MKYFFSVLRKGHIFPAPKLFIHFPSDFFLPLLYSKYMKEGHIAQL